MEIFVRTRKCHQLLQLHGYISEQTLCVSTEETGANWAGWECQASGGRWGCFPSSCSPLPFDFMETLELGNKWIRQQWTLYLWNQRQRSEVIHSNSCTYSSSLTETSSSVCHPAWTETCAWAKHAHSHAVTTTTGLKNKTVSPKKSWKCLSKGKETTKLFWYNQIDRFSQLNMQSTRCL